MLFIQKLQGSRAYVGYEVLEPFVAYHVPCITDAERGSLLEDLHASLRALDSRATLRMPSLDCFDDELRGLRGC